MKAIPVVPEDEKDMRDRGMRRYFIRLWASHRSLLDAIFDGRIDPEAEHFDTPALAYVLAGVSNVVTDALSGGEGLQTIHLKQGGCGCQEGSDD